MDLHTIRNYETWLTDPYFGEETRKELQEIKGNAKEIEDRFYKNLEFGTAGLRGIIGAGTNRMNIYTVRRVTQGLADHIKTQGKDAMAGGVVIAYDCRHFSKEFTQEAALVLAANGIKAYVFEDLRPTPELSFAVRQCKATAGIVITASHNPPDYNGYKVYWDDGAQINTFLATKIIDAIDQIPDFNTIKRIEQKEAEFYGLYHELGKEMDDLYIEEVKAQCLRPDLIKKEGKDFKVIFTPLHGTANLHIRQVLKEVGFEQVIVVPEQECPDPNFSTVKSPNPEEREAFALAIELAEKEGADLIIGTDPDGDRVGAVVKNKTGQYIVLTGNQTGALLIHYILDNLKDKNEIPVDGKIIKTIVTSEMGTKIAANYGVEMLNTLTGFKFIAEQIKGFESTGKGAFIFGYEESYGYLKGTYARDKDAVVAAMLICEMAASYREKDMNLYDGLLALYEEYGYFAEGLKSITLKGKEGLEKIQSIIEKLRSQPIKKVGDRKVLILEDYLLQQRKDMVTGKVETMMLPPSNVLKLKLEGNAWITLRPSGTEPKLKVYGAVQEKTLEESHKKLEEIIEYMLEVIK
ncbi:phosphoglucomutase/phosphomannomutase alpha/beta/alpha domain I [Alkaliphilus metalliredigens QYMF]|uniref:Phosphoglucomutase n=1 Tax=Alkaliphilus metalliredigens (strain QYMF) TaxID=293826 RepID=A6TL64_ALKMQ|nr:phospho-sugar mutase [Alkaliphilus metalliredigens]ABR46932.1 phosphoglucomutase/phosphomannomutase alpha/beta/alpha domain I [Alkaliphilus metalliredigens QYMF]